MKRRLPILAIIALPVAGWADDGRTTRAVDAAATAYGVRAEPPGRPAARVLSLGARVVGIVGWQTLAEDIDDLRRSDEPDILDPASGAARGGALSFRF